MRERKDIDTMFANDLMEQVTDLKDVAYNLSKVMQLGYDVLAMQENATMKKDTCVSFIGVSAYVTSKMNDELGILMQLIDTI